MSMVHCPECNKIVSQYAESCPECGFPIKKFLDEHGIQNPENFLLCPKCAYGYDSYFDFDPPYIKCKYCGEIVIETKEDVVKMRKMDVLTATHEQYNERCIELAKQYGKFSQEAFDDTERQREEFSERISKEREETRRAKKQPSTPHCPTCNSTNIKRISTASKAVGVGLFGIFSKTARSQFECKDCGYKW